MLYEEFLENHYARTCTELIQTRYHALNPEERAQLDWLYELVRRYHDMTIFSRDEMAWLDDMAGKHLRRDGEK
jgi:hypothetical protein